MKKRIIIAVVVLVIAVAGVWLFISVRKSFAEEFFNRGHTVLNPKFVAELADSNEEFKQWIDRYTSVDKGVTANIYYYEKAEDYGFDHKKCKAGIALEWMRAREFGKAIRALDNTELIDGTYYDSWYFKYRSYLYMGEYEKALALLDDYEKHKSDPLDQRMNIPALRVRVFIDMEDYDRAISGLEKALEWESVLDESEKAQIMRDIRDFIPYLTSRAYALSGRSEEGLKRLMMLESEYGMSCPYCYGIVYEKMGNYEIAIEYYMKQLKGRSGEPGSEPGKDLPYVIPELDTDFRIAETYLAMGREDAALKYYRKFLEEHAWDIIFAEQTEAAGKRVGLLEKDRVSPGNAGGSSRISCFVHNKVLTLHRG